MAETEGGPKDSDDRIIFFPKGFNPGADGGVVATVLQADGQWPPFRER